jgi:hypothetical protein
VVDRVPRSLSAASVAKWEKRRRRGPFVFTVTYAGIALALLALILAAGGFMLGGELEFVTRHLWLIAVVFVVGGTICGAVSWLVMERAYKRSRRP